MPVCFAAKKCWNINIKTTASLEKLNYGLHPKREEKFSATAKEQAVCLKIPTILWRVAMMIVCMSNKNSWRRWEKSLIVNPISIRLSTQITNHLEVRAESFQLRFNQCSHIRTMRMKDEITHSKVMELRSLLWIIFHLLLVENPSYFLAWGHLYK